jgi:hypothetical protein
MRIMSASGTRADPMETGLNILESFSKIECLKEYWQYHNPHPENAWRVYWEAIRDGNNAISPFVVARFRDGIPEGILIGRIEPGWVSLRIGYWKPIRIRVRRIAIRGQGFIAAEAGRVAPFLTAGVVKGLRDGRADIAVFENVELGSALHHAVVGAPVGFLLRDHVREKYLHWRLDLPTSFQEYWRTHHKLVRKVRKFEKDFGERLRYRRFHGENDIEPFCEVVEDLAKRTYQRALRVGFLNSREDKAKLRAAAQEGAWEAYVADIDGHSVAFWSGIRANEIFFQMWTGYDSALWSYSPGLVCCLRMLEQLSAEGICVIDFGVGNTIYKERLGCSPLWEEDVCLYAPSLRGIAASLIRLSDAAIRNFTNQRLRAVAAMVKTPWRRRMARKQSLSSGSLGDKKETGGAGEGA